MQRNFAKLAYAMCEKFRADGEINQFCGFVQSKKAEDFLSGNKNIFSSLIYEARIYKAAKEEKLDLEYLKQMEKEYGIPNLWPYFLADRLLMMSYPIKEYSNDALFKYEDMLKIMQVTFREVINYYKKEKPDFVVFSAIASTSTLIMYQVARKMGIKTHTIEHTRVKNFVTITDNGNEGYSIANALFQRIRAGSYVSKNKDAARKLILDYKEIPIPRIWKGAYRRSSFLKILWLEFFGFFKYLRAYYKECRYLDYQEQKPIDYLKNRSVRGFRRLMNYNSEFKKFNEEDNYVYFPLHTDPELSTMVLGPYFTDQVALAHNIAKALPVGFKLYIKEHPGMAYIRPKSYYKRLNEMANIVVIHQDFSSAKLLQNCKALVTVSGTAGLEALYLGKPVITFGKVFYNEISFVHKITDLTKLADLFQNIFSQDLHNEDELIDFISAIIDTSTSLDLFKLWHETKPEDINKSKEFTDFVVFFEKIIKKDHGK